MKAGSHFPPNIQSNSTQALTTFSTTSGGQNEGDRGGIVKLFLFQYRAKIRAIKEKMKKEKAQASLASVSRTVSTSSRGSSTGVAAKQGRPGIVTTLLE